MFAYLKDAGLKSQKHKEFIARTDCCFYPPLLFSILLKSSISPISLPVSSTAPNGQPPRTATELAPSYAKFPITDITDNTLLCQVSSVLLDFSSVALPIHTCQDGFMVDLIVQNCLILYLFISVIYICRMSW